MSNVFSWVHSVTWVSWTIHSNAVHEPSVFLLCGGVTLLYVYCDSSNCWLDTWEEQLGKRVSVKGCLDQLSLRTWVCLFGIRLAALIGVGRHSLKVDAIIPWFGAPDLIRVGKVSWVPGMHSSSLSPWILALTSQQCAIIRNWELIEIPFLLNCFISGDFISVTEMKQVFSHWTTSQLLFCFFVLCCFQIASHYETLASLELST